MRSLTRRWVLLGCALAVVASATYVTVAAPTDGVGEPPVLEGRNSAFKHLADGAPLPDAVFFDESDKTLRFADFQGKLVLVNLWATWCPPCLKEMPALDELQAHFADAAFEVVAICSQCASLEAIRSFFASKNIQHLAVYTDPELEILPVLGVRGLPTSILLDPKGNELGRLEGDAEWASPQAKALVQYYLDAFADG